MVGAAGRVRIPAVSGPGPVPWRAWARSLVGLTPTQAAVVAVLAELADWRGEMVVSVAWLAERSMRPPRSVKRALAGLEADGVIVRRRRRSGGHQGASLVSLVPAPVVRPEGDAEAVVYAFPDVRGAGPVASGRVVPRGSWRSRGVVLMTACPFRRGPSGRPPCPRPGTARWRAARRGAGRRRA